MYVSIKKSTSQSKKLMAVFYDKNKTKLKTTHFGASSYESYPDHQDLQRKQNYLSRHSNENWNDYMTAGSLSRWILWGKPSLSASIEDYIRRFKLSPL